MITAICRITFLIAFFLIAVLVTAFLITALLITPLINFFPHKIWCRITPFLTNFICGTVIVIVICVNNKSSCVCPIFPPCTSNSYLEDLTCFINAYISRSILLIRKYFIKPIKNISWRFRFWTFGPCHDNSTWCTCHSSGYDTTS